MFAGWVFIVVRPQRRAVTRCSISAIESTIVRQMWSTVVKLFDRGPFPVLGVVDEKELNRDTSFLGIGDSIMKQRLGSARDKASRNYGECREREIAGRTTEQSAHNWHARLTCEEDHGSPRKTTSVTFSGGMIPRSERFFQ
jgi:hypothetical protein